MHQIRMRRMRLMARRGRVHQIGMRRMSLMAGSIHQMMMMMIQSVILNQR